MLTIEKLKEFGADVEDGLVRCMNKEDFYLKLVGKAIEDNRLTLLGRQLGEKDLKGAFETAHALKGMYSNLSLNKTDKRDDRITQKRNRYRLYAPS